MSDEEFKKKWIEALEARGINIEDYKQRERIEIALLDLAEAIQEGSWQGVYQHTANTLHPINPNVTPPHHE
jgi:hypothetical protein